MAEVPSAATVRALLSYDPATGVFRWLQQPARKTKIGSIAGGPSRTGHWRIRVHGARHLAHRLAWLHVHGSWPESDLDHINGDPADNRIDNLRPTTHQANMQNQRVATSRSASGVLGVSWCKRNKRWRACITTSGRSQHLGLFDCIEAASAAYIDAKRAQHAGCTL